MAGRDCTTVGTSAGSVSGETTATILGVTTIGTAADDEKIVTGNSFDLLSTKDGVMLRPYKLKTWACRVHGSGACCMVNYESQVWNRKWRHYLGKKRERNWKRFRKTQWREK